MNKFLIIIVLALIPSCMPLTTNSELILNMKKNMEITSENLILVGKKTDKIADKLGLDLPPVTAELKDALKQLQADNDKKYELLNGQMAEVLKTLAKVGLSAAGVPPSVTNAGITATEAIMGTGVVAGALKMGNDYLIARRRKQEHEQAMEELKEQAEREKEEHAKKVKEEAEKEKEGIRLRLEREKEELRVKGLIKAETMAYIKEESQQEFISARERAIKSLKARGEI